MVYVVLLLALKSDHVSLLQTEVLGTEQIRRKDFF